jgi:hypothetical protein
VNVESIKRLDLGRYEAQLESIEGNQRYAFVFSVDSTTDGIDVVQSPPEFAAFMKLNMGPAAPLFAAVLKFHHAQNLSL